MRTTIDIPDELYKNVRILAIEKNATVKQMVLEGLELLFQIRNSPVPQERAKFPQIASTRTDKLVIDNETIYDLIDFP
jgi:hypothetical protein